MRRTTSISPYSTGPRILAPPESQKITAFQNGCSLYINGKLIPIPAPEVPQYTPPVQIETPEIPTQTLTPVQSLTPVQNLTGSVTPTQTLVSPGQPLYVLAVKKRNLYMENKVFIDIEKYDVYEVVCFYNNEKGATLAYTYYTPDNSNEWRVLSKVLKRVPYNSNVNIDNCETVYEETL